MNSSASTSRDTAGTGTGRLLAVHQWPVLTLVPLFAILLWMAFGKLEETESHQACLDILNDTLAVATQLELLGLPPEGLPASEPGKVLARSLLALSTTHGLSAHTPQAELARRRGTVDLLAVQTVLVDGEAILRALQANELLAAVRQLKTSSHALIRTVSSRQREDLAALKQLGFCLAGVLVLGALLWLCRLRPRSEVQTTAEHVLDARRELRLEGPRDEELNLLQTIIDSIDGGIIVFDADNRVLFCNNFYRRISRLPEALLRAGTEAAMIYRYLATRNPINLGSRTLEEYIASQLAELRAANEGTELTIGERTYVRANRVLPNGCVIGLRTDITAVKRAQSQLNERSELLELALDASNDGLWDWNIEANQNYLSPRWKALLGYADDEIGNSLSVWQAHIHPDDRDAVARAVEAHLDHQTLFDIEYRMQHRSGEWRWFHVRGRALLGPEGRPRRMAGFTADIHDRKMQALELERTRALLSDAIEALDAGLVRYDADARLVFCNRRFSKLYGFPPELAVPGTTERDLIADFQQRNAAHLELSEREVVIEQALARTRVVDKPFELQAASRWLRISTSETADGGRVILTTDITRLKNVQAELTLAMQRAEAANVAKSQFLANMSHELRTPLNGVIGMLQVLEGARLDSPHDGHVDLALRSGRSLLGLINDILDLSRIQSGALTLEKIDFDLGDLLADAIAPITVAAGAKGLALQTHLDPTVPIAMNGDPTRLRQVLINLLGNALKFTEQGSIALNVSCLPGAALVRYEVADTGIGISAEQLDHIFDRFAQADSSITRRYGGAGLGLAISQELVSAMGGRLNIESKVGVGTRLWFDLPLEAAEGLKAPLPPARGAKVRFAGRVLVVDDAETNRLVALAMLERLGLAGEAVDGGEAVLSKISSEVPDLILMDCQMPGIDGFETTRQLQARLGEACPPIIALTANVGARDREQARSAGMCDFVPKPVSLDALAAVLERWLPARLSQLPATDPVATSDVLSSSVLGELRQTFDAAGLEYLFTTFVDSMEKLIGRLPEQVAAGNAGEVSRLCHAMKGICSNVGAVKLVERVVRLEGAAKAGSLVGFEAEEVLLRKGVAEVAAEVRALDAVGA